MITILEPAPSRDLVTLADFKTIMGISSGDTSQDALISLLITQASDFIASYTGREFAKAKVAETLASSGGDILVLSRTPIAEVYSVEFDGNEIDGAEYDIDDDIAGFLWNENGWTSTINYRQIITVHPSRFGSRKWRVTYDGGYTLKSFGSGTPNLPTDIEKACMDLSKFYYMRRAEAGDVVSQRLGDAYEYRSVSGNVSIDLPAPIKSALDNWIRVV